MATVLVCSNGYGKAGRVGKKKQINKKVRLKKEEEKRRLDFGTSTRKKLESENIKAH